MLDGETMRRNRRTRSCGHVLARLGLLSALLAALATPTRGELIILADGGFMTAKAFSIDNDRIRLELPSGGVLTMPLLRIERILDDEIVEKASVDVEAPAPVFFPLHFDAAHQQPATPYGDLIYGAAERHGVNPALVAAVVRAESAYQREAVSVKGARGLMQLMPATAERFGVQAEQITDPATNLDAGTRYLRWLIERFEERLPLVLAAYNAGEGTVQRYGGVPPYRETWEYIRRIYRYLELPLELVFEASSSGVMAGGS